MSLPKPTIKILEKLMMEMNTEIKELKADFGKGHNDLRKGQKDLAEEMRELKEELTIQKKKVFELEKCVNFISGDYDKLKKENEEIKNEIELLKADNTKLSETASKVEDGGDLFQKVNQMDNFLRRSNVEIQGIPVTDNENLEDVVMNTLKLVDPHIQRKDVVSFRRMKPTGMAEDRKNVFNPILVKFRLFEQKVKIMKEKKKLANCNFNTIGKNVDRVYINENLTPYSRDLLYHTRRFQKANGWRYSWSSGGAILMREKENSKAILIRCVKDLTKYLKKDC